MTRYVTTNPFPFGSQEARAFNDDGAWFRNEYAHEECGTSWSSEWSCGVDEECPKCGVDISPTDSVEIYRDASGVDIDTLADAVEFHGDEGLARRARSHDWAGVEAEEIRAELLAVLAERVPFADVGF